MIESRLRISIPWERFQFFDRIQILPHRHRNNSNSQISQSDWYSRNFGLNRARFFRVISWVSVDRSAIIKSTAQGNKRLIVISLLVDLSMDASVNRSRKVYYKLYHKGLISSLGNYGLLYTIRYRFHIGLRWGSVTCENGMKLIGLVRSCVNKGPIRCELKTVSCKHKASPIWNQSDRKWKQYQVNGAYFSRMHDG